MDEAEKKGELVCPVESFRHTQDNPQDIRFSEKNATTLVDSAARFPRIGSKEVTQEHRQRCIQRTTIQPLLFLLTALSLCV